MFIFVVCREKSFVRLIEGKQTSFERFAENCSDELFVAAKKKKTQPRRGVRPSPEVVQLPVKRFSVQLQDHYLSHIAGAGAALVIDAVSRRMFHRPDKLHSVSS